MAAAAQAQSCVFAHIDHRVTKDESGIWNPNTYRGLMDALTIAQIGGALWEGAESRFGKTMWQGIDSELISGVSAYVLQPVFGRVRPSEQGSDPCMWFESGSHHSFPSGEAAVAAGLVTPYILEYQGDHPVTWLLALLPAYIGTARVKNQAHWQSDVVAGWAVGGLSGWYAHERDVPIFVQILPHGVSVGLRKRF
jgi:undecaprenyl-diphosphatase